MPQTALALGLGEGPEASCSIELASPADTAWNEVSTRQRAEAAPVRGAVGCARHGRAAFAAVAAQAGDWRGARDVAGAAATSAEAGTGSGGPPEGAALSRPGSRCSDLHWSSEAAFAIRLASPRGQWQPSRAITAAAEAEGQPTGQHEGPGQAQRQPAQVTQRLASPCRVCDHPLCTRTCSRKWWCLCTQHMECRRSACVAIVACVQAAQLQLAKGRQMERGARPQGLRLRRRHAGEQIQPDAACNAGHQQHVPSAAFECRQLSRWSQAISSSHPRAASTQVMSSPAAQGASVGRR